MRHHVVAAALIAPLAAPAAADCPTVATDLAEAWLAGEPAPAPQIADMEEALCIQGAFATAVGGEQVGWKVGLTSEAAQQQFGVTAPLAGRLLAGMVLEDGATVPRDYGARPMAEADLVVTVTGEGIMEATTRREVLEHLDAFVPFIELADLVIAEGETFTPEILTAINVGARYGVAGEPLNIEATDEWEDALAEMTIRLEDETGTILGDHPGAAILGHPLDAVLWLIETLNERGESLREGDMISLGSFGPPVEIPEVGGLRATYFRLPGGEEPTVLVLFE